MPHMYDVQLRDFSRETSTSQIFIGPITAITVAGLLTQIGTYRAAVDGITLGELAAETIVMDKTVLSADAPASAFAQRELKWLVRYHGATSNKKFQLEIPTPDLTDPDILVPGTDFADLTFGVVSTWVTAFEALAKSPDDDTEDVIVDQIVLVGRNL